METKTILRIATALLLVPLLASCFYNARPDTDQRKLTILAASSLTQAFGEIAAEFENRNPGVMISLSVGGSQTLAEQLAHGAPADVFASASTKYMDAAIAAGRIDTKSTAVFARNRLAILVPMDNPAGILAAQDLAKPGITLVLASEAVPAGQYSLAFLEKASNVTTYGADYGKKVLANVVSYETDVKAVVSKLVLGEADAGIAYVSDYTLSEGSLRLVEIPPGLNSIAEYPIGLINDSPNPILAQAFLELVLSPDGQAILARHGFLPMAAGANQSGD